MKGIDMKDMGSEMLAWQFHTSHYFVVHAALFPDLHSLLSKEENSALFF